MWIEALVVLGRPAEGSASQRGVQPPTSSDFDGRPAILRCIPPKAREELPPQLGVCCLPTGIQRKPYHHRSLNKYYEQYNIILTDSTGRKTYGYCCTFYDVCAEPGEGGPAEDDFAYTKCLCLISKDPLYDTFEALVRVAHRCCFAQRSVLGCDYGALRDLVLRVNSLRREPGGTVHLLMPIAGRPVHLEFERPPEGSPRAFQYRELLGVGPKVLSCLFFALLLERKVILRSASRAKLSGCSEALCELLYPLNWQHIYIPIVPEQLTEYLEAPTPYLMGVLSTINTKNLVHEQSVEVDLDNSTASFGDDFALPYSEDVSALMRSLEGLGIGRTPGRAVAARDTPGLERDLRSLFLQTVMRVLGEARGHLAGSSGEGKAIDAEAEAGEGSEFLQCFMETQMFQIFFHDSPGLLKPNEFAAMSQGLSKSFSLASRAARVGGEVEIVTHQSMLPPTRAAADLRRAERDALARSTQRGEYGASGTTGAGQGSELRAEAARSQRRVDMGESGLRVVGEGGAEGEAGPSLSDKAEELLDCVYLYFQGKYGNLLLGTTGSIVRQCIDGVGSAEHLAAMVDVFKLAIMEERGRKVVFRSLHAMERLMPVLSDVVMRAAHVGDHILAFGILAMSLHVEHEGTQDVNFRISGFDYITEDFPGSRSFWVDLVSSIARDASGLEAEEAASGYEFVADLLLLCRALFPGDPWYEPAVQNLAERITGSEVSANDVRLMSLLCDPRPALRPITVAPDSRFNLEGRFDHGGLESMLIPACGEAELAKNSATSPVTSMDSNSNLLIAATCDGMVHLYRGGLVNDTPSSFRVPTWSLKHKSQSNVVTIHPEGSNFFVASKRIGVWDAKSLRVVKNLENGAQASCICVNGASRGLIVVGDEAGACKVWDYRSPSSSPSLLLSGHSARINKITHLEGDQDAIVSSSRDGRALLWDLRKVSEPLLTMIGHDSWITDHHTFYWGGAPHLVCGSEDWTATVWSLQTGDLACTHEGHSRPVRSVAACSKDAAGEPVIASGDADGVIQFWRASVEGVLGSGETLRSVRPCEAPVLALEPQGCGTLLSCHERSVLARWDLVEDDGGGLRVNCGAYQSTRETLTAFQADNESGLVHGGCRSGRVVSWKHVGS